MSNPQWKAITDSLRSRIESGELRPGYRLPSEQDVAAEWGVSRHTAHRAIRELQGIGLVVRQRRWGTVVQPPRLGTGRVAFLFDQAAHHYNFPSWQVIRGIQDRLGSSVDLICRECKRDPEEEARLLEKLGRETDGILIYPTADPKNTQLLQAISDRNRLIVLDRVPPGLEADSVVSENYESTRLAMTTLLKSGHKRIGFFSFRKPGFSSVAERFAGYRESVEDSERHVRWFSNELDLIPDSFLQAVHDSLFTLLHQPEPITALFCVQDSFAVAALRACEGMGIRIPEDLEIATFNDWPPMMLQKPWLFHRIVQNGYEIGFEAGRVLSERIAGSSEPRSVRRIAPKLFSAGERESSDDFSGLAHSLSRFQPMEVIQ